MWFLLSGPPSEILPTVHLGPEAERKERAEEEGEEETTEAETDGGIMEQEEKERGVVKLAVYSAYWKAVGSCLSPLILLSLFFMQGMVLGEESLEKKIILRWPCCWQDIEIQKLWKKKTKQQLRINLVALIF